MEMRKKSTCMLLVIFVTLTCIQMSRVQCRKLRLASGTAMMGDCNQVAATNPFVVAANNSGSISSAMETLGFIFASGPSKKGAVH
ncbi:hypothetical protein Dimus_020705 [Dionaea muscipula]